jgi:hypothetical protein
MTAEEILIMIKNEISVTKEFFNPHHVDLDSALVYPVQQLYFDPIDQSKTLILWTVLEETPDRKGYKIFFSESEGLFGLGICTENDELLALGYYGSFITTLSCM